jgi:hypothetical protein
MARNGWSPSIGTTGRHQSEQVVAIARCAQLAECLYLKMERMDPNNRGSWSQLSDGEQEFYLESIREILLEKTLLAIAMRDSSVSPTTM